MDNTTNKAINIYVVMYVWSKKMLKNPKSCSTGLPPPSGVTIGKPKSDGRSINQPIAPFIVISSIDPIRRAINTTNAGAIILSAVPPIV